MHFARIGRVVLGDKRCVIHSVGLNHNLLGMVMFKRNPLRRMSYPMTHLYEILEMAKL